MSRRPRVALVYPTQIQPGSFFGYLLPPMGLERLAAAIEDVADVEIFDVRFDPDVVTLVARMRPDVVGISLANTMTSAYAYSCAREVRAALPDARIVLGGLHATSCPEEGLAHADFVVRGEGEAPFRQLVLGAKPADIRGLAYHADGRHVLNPLAPPLHDLDQLRPPARHLRKPRYRYAAAGLIPMDLLETSRGCTHACSFCSPASVYPHRWRAHSPAYILEEIRRLDARGVKMCLLTDDHFGGDPVRTEEICDLVIASGIRIAFFCFIRAFKGNMALKRKMVAAGFVLVTYGAESPSIEQLRRYGKGYPTQSTGFLQTVNAEWHEAGARYIGNSYVFGDVADTAESLAALGTYARQLDATYIEPLYAQPYPNTRYRAELVAEDKVLPLDWSHYTEGRLLLAHPELDAAQLKRLRVRVWVDFFSPRKAAAGTLGFPLYLYQQVGLTRLTVLRYLWACRYTVFGCFLEEKYYRDLQVEMVEDYFRRALPSFEPRELDLTPQAGQLDAFLALLGLARPARWLGDADLVTRVTDDGRVLASALIALRAGQVAEARVVPGTLPASGVRQLAVDLPLRPLARALGTERPGAWAELAARARLGADLRRTARPRR